MQSLIGLIVGLLGLHMLAAAVRRRALAEAAIGVFFVASAVGAECSLRAVAGDLPPALALRLLFAGVPALTLATIAGYWFTYAVFRRGEPWALLIVALGTVLAGWGTWYQLSGPTGGPDMSGLRVEFLIGRFACFAWGSYEALRAYAMARRRLALGLADPVVVNRFLLFGVWFGVMGAMPMTLALLRIRNGAAAQAAASNVGPTIVGTFMIVALILTFFPPRPYREWLTARRALRGARA